MNGILVDTSVWRRYLAGRTTKQQTRTMEGLLDEDDGVLTHEAIVGELVLGGLGEQEEELLVQLPHATALSNADVLAFIKARGLPRRGVGWVDAHLLASALVTAAALWSLDRKLARVADELDIAFVAQGAG